jgi:NADPH:quinone reductase-like Zn-dependent oxidoreductase
MSLSTKPSIPENPDGETMKAVCFTAFGKDSDALSVKTIPKPFISTPNEVLIKVHASALNPVDKYRLAGGLSGFKPEQYDTCVFAYDISGVIEKVGDEASNSFKVGDEVYACITGLTINADVKYGAVAEYVVCPMISMIGKKPSNLSFSEAASIPLAGLTALQALRTGGVTEGSKVFIPAGAGGVGSLAIQIAKKMLKAGHVCTTASPGIGTEICTKAGADRIVDYRAEDFGEVLQGEDFDMIFDTMNEVPKMRGLLNKGGKIISITGNANADGIADEVVKEVDGTWKFMFMDPSGKDLDEMGIYIESGDMIPFIDTVAESLEDFKVAVDKLFSGRSKGKCVINVV